jgi:hypothetical protein
MPQTTYNLGPNPAQAGQPLSNDKSMMRVMSVRAGVVIPFGVLCETYAGTDGTLLARPVQDSTTGSNFAPTLCGISLADVFAAEMGYTVYAVPPSTTGNTFSGYPVGYSVPMVYDGGIWAVWDGNTGTALPKNGSIQVWHSSNGVNPQGQFTTKAAQGGVGTEIDAAGAYIQVWDPFVRSGAYTDSFGNVNNLVSIMINLPGHS